MIFTYGWVVACIAKIGHHFSETKLILISISHHVLVLKECSILSYDYQHVNNWSRDLLLLEFRGQGVIENLHCWLKVMAKLLGMGALTYIDGVRYAHFQWIYYSVAYKDLAVEWSSGVEHISFCLAHFALSLFWLRSHFYFLLSHLSPAQ